MSGEFNRSDPPRNDEISAGSILMIGTRQKNLQAETNEDLPSRQALQFHEQLLRMNRFVQHR